MRLYSSNYKNKNIVYELSEKIYEQIKNNNEIVIVNIGTDRCIPDAVGCITGTILKKNDIKFNVYGTIKEPIHALNIERKIHEIKTNHPNAFIIGIDACLGDNKDIGEIRLNDYPINPGRGVGKTLPSVGDISIIAIVDDADNNVIFTNRNLRLDFIYDMAEIISKSIIKAEEKYNTYSNNDAIPQEYVKINKFKYIINYIKRVLNRGKVLN